MDINAFKNKTWDLIRAIADNLNSTFSPVVEKYGLTIMQVRILLEIWRHGDHTIGSLGKSMSIAGGNISAMCKKLEKEDYLERIRSQDDERVVNVVLTQKGRETVLEIDKAFQRRYAAVLVSEPQKTFDEIILGLEKLNSLLQEINMQDKVF